MTTLFLDTSHFLNLGLLDDDFNWKQFQIVEETKGSAVIHTLLYEMLNKEGLKLKDIARVFISSGPGSYTGMRLSHGLAQVLQWQEVKVLSFYNFEIPYYLGQLEGAWVSNAHKSEAFVFQWKGKETQSKLVSLKELEEIDLGDKVFTHNMAKFSDIIPGLHSTLDLIKENSATLFRKVEEIDLVREPYYYRKLEEEFKPSFFE